MNIEALSDYDKNFIQNHLQDDVYQLSMQQNKFNNSKIRFLICQITARQHAKRKLPAWYSNFDLLFPAVISVEQSSSAQTADYKASLCGGDSLVDLTCGFGVDAFTLSKHFRSVICLESNLELASIVQFNAKQLQLNHIKVLNEDCVTFLQKIPSPNYDWIFIDPSRRNASGERVSSWEDYSPDILKIKDLLLKKGKKVLIKLSPMTDIKQLLRYFPETKALHILSVENECKEILLILHKDSNLYPDEIPYTMVNFGKKGTQSLQISEKEDAAGKNKAMEDFSENMEGEFLYEPNAAIMKSGLFFALVNLFNVHKIHYHSHLYISRDKIDNFPGRIFKIEKVFYDFSKKSIKELKKISDKMNVTTRNFPIGVDELRKRLQLKEGGDYYLFATTALNGHILVLTRKT